MEWLIIDDAPPKEKGYYAILISYDHDDIFIPLGAYWNGERFDAKRPVCYLNKRFSSQEAAEEHAKSKDPMI